MENKETYMVQNEIKVKNLLSDMYHNESSVLSRIRKKKEQLEHMKSDLEEAQKDYENQKKLRIELTSKFNDLQKTGSSAWEDFRKEYEMILNFAEGDKTSFIKTAESFIEELNDKILELEKSAKDKSSELKEKSRDILNELKERKSALQSRLEEAKEDSGEVWIEVKQWFIERANSIRALFTVN